MLDYDSLSGIQLTDRVIQLKDDYFRAVPEVCTERALLVTKYHKDMELLDVDRISPLEKAKVYKKILKKKKPIVRFGHGYDKNGNKFSMKDRNIFPGSTTSKFRGVPIYPEFLGLSIWPELRTIDKRDRNRYEINQREIDDLNEKIFPFWMDFNIMEYGRREIEKMGLKYAREGYDLAQRLVFFLPDKPNCISHTIPDFFRALKEGFKGMEESASKKIMDTEDKEKREFYKAMKVVLEGIIDYAGRLADEAESMIVDDTGEEDRKDLEAISKTLRNIVERKPETFREGLTTIWLIWIAIHLENPNVAMSLGRLDQVLYDLYTNDMKNGKLNEEEAIEMLCCLWLRIGDHVPMIPDVGEQLFGGTGSNQAITIGGITPEGDDAVNELTYLILKSIELMKLRDPNLNARYHPDVNTDEYLESLCKVNVITGATPALHNDRSIIDALVARGVYEKDARDYGVIGCVEPCSCGRSYLNSSAIMLNLTSVLEMTLFNGKHRHTKLKERHSMNTGDPASFKNIEELRNAFERHLDLMVERTTSLNDVFGKVHQRIYPTPVLSSFFKGPTVNTKNGVDAEDKALDLIDGGAIYNSSGVTIIGLADVADSLSAIEHWVFDEKKITMNDMIAAIEGNYKGKKGVKIKELLKGSKTPKYGNQDPLADEMVEWIVNLLDDKFGSRTNYRGGGYRVGYWSMTNHAGFGRLMGAMPNGRSKGENFSSGITPVSMATPDLTPMLNSVGGLPNRSITNGMALNVKYTPESGDINTMIKNFMGTVKGYFSGSGPGSLGGMEVQFNIINRDKLMDAYRNPENYNELLVRVSGYTAYFKDLNNQMKQEIINRTEYDLDTKKMVDHNWFRIGKGGS